MKRTARKVLPKQSLLYFESDKSLYIVPTKHIIDEEKALSTKVSVLLPQEAEKGLQTALITALSDNTNTLQRALDDFEDDPQNAHLFDSPSKNKNLSAPPKKKASDESVTDTKQDKLSVSTTKDIFNKALKPLPLKRLSLPAKSAAVPSPSSQTPILSFSSSTPDVSLPAISPLLPSPSQISIPSFSSSSPDSSSPETSAVLSLPSQIFIPSISSSSPELSFTPTSSVFSVSSQLSILSCPSSLPDLSLSLTSPLLSLPSKLPVPILPYSPSPDLSLPSTSPVQSLLLPSHATLFLSTSTDLSLGTHSPALSPYLSPKSLSSLVRKIDYLQENLNSDIEFRIDEMSDQEILVKLYEKSIKNEEKLEAVQQPVSQEQ